MIVEEILWDLWGKKKWLSHMLSNFHIFSSDLLSHFCKNLSRTYFRNLRCLIFFLWTKNHGRISVESIPDLPIPIVGGVAKCSTRRPKHRRGSPDLFRWFFSMGWRKMVEDAFVKSHGEIHLQIHVGAVVYDMSILLDTFGYYIKHSSII